MQSAGMLVRRAAFDQVGPLDPAFFVYSDEVDWQRRARDAGWSVLYVPAATIMHREQLSGDTGSKRRIVEFARNRDTYVRKHHGRLAALAVRVLTAWSLRGARAGCRRASRPQRPALRVARVPFAVPRPGRGAARGSGRV